MTSRSLAARSSRVLSLVPPDAPALVPLIKRPAPVRHAASVYIVGLAKGSQSTQETALRKIALLVSDGKCDFWTLPWGDLRFEHTNAIRARVAEELSPNTARRYICALKGALKAAWRLRQIESEDYQRAIDLPPIPGQKLPRGRWLSPGEVAALFAACAADTGVIGARDAAILAVALGAGLRRAELTGLDLDDYDPETGAIRVSHGKGDKERIAYGAPGTYEALDYWIEFRGRRSGPLFTPLTRSGRILRRRMNDQTIMALAHRRFKGSGIKRFTPHDLRHTMISNILGNGEDLSTAQKLAGHKSPVTTAGYDRRGEENKRRAAGGLHIPFSRPSQLRR